MVLVKAIVVRHVAKPVAVIRVGTLKYMMGSREFYDGFFVKTIAALHVNFLQCYVLAQSSTSRVARPSAKDRDLFWTHGVDTTRNIRIQYCGLFQVYGSL